MPCEINRRRRGHQFYPTKRELARCPDLTYQLRQGIEAIAYVHYFDAEHDWYITGIADDLESKQVAFGYIHDRVTRTGYFAFISLSTLEAAYTPPRKGKPHRLVERDLRWEPKTVAEAIKASQ